jgi:hypothetical protein
VSAVDASALNVEETYTVDLIQGDRRTGVVSPITRQGGGTFTKPLDNVGAKTIPDYAAYAASHVYDVSFPTTAGCGGAVGKIFVGQRREGFHMNLGEVFDLINGDFDPGTPAFDLLGPQDQAKDALVGKNVTSICIEIPSHCLRTNTSPNPVIGGWATASKRQVRVLNPSPDLTHKPTAEGGAWTQVSRVGMPLVDQLMIGLRDKDRFDSSEPLGDAQFATYFTHPTFPEIMEIFFGGSGIQAPNLFPRVDLVDVFLEGITGLNAPASVQPSEMLRLNLDVAPVEASFQDSLGHLAGDSAGFPNGRRPGDDVVDILWRLLMGARLPSGFAPSGGLPFVDGAFRGALSFDSTFPYLQHPLPGSPQ